MELIALGTYGPYPMEGTATSGYLLKVNDAFYLFDMGSGVYARMLEYVKDLNQLKAIFLTHLHYDHISDISVFKYASTFKIEKDLLLRPPKIYHPENPVSLSNTLKQGDAFEHHIIDENYVFEDQQVKITFHPMKHPVETYGVRVEAEGKVFVYTSDTAYFESLPQFVEDADLLVINCGYQNKDKPEMPNHLCSDEVAKLVQEGQVKQALATHFFAENSMQAIEKELFAYGIKALSPIKEMRVYPV